MRAGAGRERLHHAGHRCLPGPAPPARAAAARAPARDRAGGGGRRRALAPGLGRRSLPPVPVRRPRPGRPGLRLGSHLHLELLVRSAGHYRSEVVPRCARPGRRARPGGDPPAPARAVERERSGRRGGRVAGPPRQALLRGNGPAAPGLPHRVADVPRRGPARRSRPSDRRGRERGRIRRPVRLQHRVQAPARHEPQGLPRSPAGRGHRRWSVRPGLIRGTSGRRPRCRAAARFPGQAPGAKTAPIVAA